MSDFKLIKTALLKTGLNRKINEDEAINLLDCYGDEVTAAMYRIDKDFHFSEKEKNKHNFRLIE